ncbi:MAG: SGNH hydrolase domain-containing protein, partial [Solirubrobacteraceae bacterium]
PECRDSDTPAVLVWGDSFAMHLVPGIAATSGARGVVQATRSICGPFLDIAPLGTRPADGVNTVWAQDCITFNRSVLEYLSRTPSIRTVVLSSSYEQYVDPGTFVTVRRTGERVLDSTARFAAAQDGLQQTLDAIHALGRRAVLVAPPPSTGFPVGTCLERIAERKLTFGAPPACAVATERYHRARARVLHFLASARDERRAPVFSFDSLLCDPTSCKTSIDGTFLYRDAGHLSEAGSRLIGRRLSLAATLEATAR